MMAGAKETPPQEREMKQQKMANTTVVLSGTIRYAGPPPVARLPLAAQNYQAPSLQYQRRQ